MAWRLAAEAASAGSRMYTAWQVFWRDWPPLELTPSSSLAFALAMRCNARARGGWRAITQGKRSLCPLTEDCRCNDQSHSGLSQLARSLSITVAISPFGKEWRDTLSGGYSFTSVYPAMKG